MIRVLIADDHAVVREGLKHILGQAGDFVVAGEADDAESVLREVGSDGYHLVLLDLNMPGVHGVDLIEKIKQARPRLPVLVLSIYKEDQIMLRAMRAGATGYLDKNSAAELLVAAARKVAAGHRYLNPRLIEVLAADLDPRHPKTGEERLTDREHQILRLIAAGKSPADIARELSLSAKTVSTHKIRMMRKLGVRNNTQLIQFALQQGLSD